MLGSNDSSYPITAMPQKTLISCFWKPPGGLWYRVLCHKLQINRRNNTLCSLCRTNEKNAIHFLCACPMKRPIWTFALGCFFPRLKFSNDQLLRTLHKLEASSIVPTSLLNSFYTLVSTIQYCMWKNNWKYVIDDTPFLPDHICYEVTSQFSLLSATTTSVID